MLVHYVRALSRKMVPRLLALICTLTFPRKNVVHERNERKTASYYISAPTSQQHSRPIFTTSPIRFAELLRTDKGFAW